MKANLENWIGAQRQAIIANWQQWDVPPVVAIEGTHVLGARSGGPEGRVSQWMDLPGVDAQRARIQQTGLVRSLWVDPADNGYVDIFRRFLDRYQVDSATLTARFDVDHMYNRERACNFGYRLVRMFPIIKSANRSHGAGYEKAMTASDLGRRRKIMKLMDEVSAMKFFGIGSPSSRTGLSVQQRAHVADMAKTFELSIEQIESGIQNLMERAHRR